jgi:phage baseplate assembly protein gpV
VRSENAIIPLRRLEQVQLAEVTAVNDPDGRNRVEVRLHDLSGPEGQEGTLCARVATPFAGNERGAFFIPDVGDEVLVSFVNGDPRYPIVIGSLWNGRDAAPERLGGGGDAVDRWSFVGKAGTRIAIVEEQQPTIHLETPGGAVAKITDQGGGKMTIDAGGSTIKVEPSGVTLETGAKVSVTAATLEVSAGMVTVDAGLSKFSGVLQCDTLLATTVVATTYTPGAGNVW